MILRLLFQGGGLENWILWHFQWVNSLISFFSFFSLLWNTQKNPRVCESHPEPWLCQQRILCFLQISHCSKWLGSASLLEGSHHGNAVCSILPCPGTEVRDLSVESVTTESSVTVPLCWGRLVPRWSLQVEVVQSGFVINNYSKAVGSASCKEYLLSMASSSINCLA